VLLKNPSLNVVHRSSAALDTATRLSPEVRARVVKMGAVGLIGEVIARRCNRSAPGRAVLGACMGIVRSLAQDPATMPAVAAGWPTIQAVVGQLQGLEASRTAEDAKALTAGIAAIEALVSSVDGFAAQLGADKEIMGTITRVKAAAKIVARVKNDDASR
jgi:hypothetical protein